jgi:hypothetical protein
MCGLTNLCEPPSADEQEACPTLPWVPLDSQEMLKLVMSVFPVLPPEVGFPLFSTVNLGMAIGFHLMFSEP